MISNWVGVRIINNSKVIVYIDVDMIICDVLINWDKLLSFYFWFLNRFSLNIWRRSESSTTLKLGVATIASWTLRFHGFDGATWEAIVSDGLDLRQTDVFVFLVLFLNLLSV